MVRASTHYVGKGKRGLVSTVLGSSRAVWRRHVAIPPWLLVAGLLVGFVALLPFVVVAIYTLEVGWSAAWPLIFRPRVGELFWNTTRLLAAAVPLCAVIGTGAAWIVGRTTLPGRRVWNILLAAPLAIPAFVNGFGWVSLTARVEGYAGAVLIVTLSYYPFVYLPVSAALRGLDPAQEEAARSLGHGPWFTFMRVVIPQLAPALLGGMLLVALHLLAEFGALQMLRFPTFTTAIYDQYQSTFNGRAAYMLAAVLVSGCIVLLAGEVGLRGRSRYARVGPGAARQVTLVRLGRLTPVPLVALAGLATLSLGVPMWSLVHWLIVGSSTKFPLGTLVSTMMSSVKLGLLGAFVTTAFALPVAWLSVRYRSRLTTLIERSTYIGHALPGIVIALSVITVAIRYVRPAYQTTTLLLVAYAIMFLPLTLVSLRAAIAQLPPALDEAARALGTHPIAAFWRVTLPVIAPGVGAGAALVFLAVVTELTATLLLAPTGTNTLATAFWSNADSIAYGAAAPYAALMILISAPSTYFLTRSARWRQGL